MKSVKKLLIVFSCIFFISISSTTNTLGINYRYNVEEGEEHTWTLIVGNPAVFLSDGSKFRVIIEDNYNGTWTEGPSTYKGTILNYSIEVYSVSDTPLRWQPAFNGSAMFFNASTWDFFINFDLEIAFLGWLFFIPTPLNLNLVGDYLNQTFWQLFADYSINGNTLTMKNFTLSIDFAYTFANNGTLTEYKMSLGNQVGYHLKYGNISLQTPQIPFGNYSLIFIVCTIIIIINYSRNRIKKNKNLR